MYGIINIKTYDRCCDGWNTLYSMERNLCQMKQADNMKIKEDRY